MPSFDEVTRHHVLQAMQEYDELGAPEFLARYGFGSSRGYWLIHDGRSYDSKAVLGIAHRFATGRQADSGEFSGGKDGAAAVLESLGFEVHSEDGTEDASSGTREQGADAAREALIGVAHRYHSVVTYKELAESVQERTGIHTRQLMHQWIGDVLRRVTEECARRDEPLLSALCVDSHGSVGRGYAVAVEATTGEQPADPDDHAAHERLACHRFFGAADLPHDGGKPALAPTMAKRRARERKARIAEAPVVTCPTCHMALPKTGICDNCD